MYRTPATRTSDARQRCLYCGRENVPGAECFNCRILVPPAAGATLRPGGCARCANPWLDAVELGPNDAVAFWCRACFSAFVNAGSWTALHDGVLAGETIRLDAFVRRPQAEALNVFPLVRCSVCRYERERARFGANTTLVIDVCNAHGVWLDPNELPVLVELLRGGADVPARAAVSEEERLDPMEALLIAELRKAESDFDINVDHRSPWRDARTQHRLTEQHLRAINKARMALDDYRLRKLETRGR